MASEEEVIENKIKPILEKLTAHILKNRPENIPLYMIEYLQKVGNITSSGLTYDEKHELESLRKQVQQYRQIEAHIKNNNDNNDESQSSVSDSEEDDVINNEEEFEKKVQSKKNNFKDKKRSGVSAEVYGNFNKKENFVPRVIEKTEEQKNKIKLRILTSFLFNSLEKKDLEIVINAMDEKTLEPDEFAIKQGDNGDCLFVVESGELECTKHFTKDGEEKHLKDYFPGDSFGELALLYNAPRAASIRAKTKCTLWVLDRETFNNIVKEASQKKRERYENFLKKVDILSTIDAYEIGQISEALKSSTFLKNDYIIKEGELGDVFYILEEGECIATKTIEPGKAPIEVMRYKSGDYFGERALVKGEPRACNIVAISDVVKVISLDRNSFKRLLGPIEPILQRNIEKYQKFVVKENDENENA